MAMMGVIIMAMLWAIIFSMQMEPFYYGISTSNLVEIVLFILILYMVSVTPILLNTALTNADNLILKRAWLESKEKYVKGRNILSCTDLVSYERILRKKWLVANHMKKISKGGGV